ncbi:MAG: hypothetical protein OXF02_00420 [Simkaniaceae bacterium]|nr:hypothetical protein [Simkaniaceae bacterium]
MTMYGYDATLGIRHEHRAGSHFYVKPLLVPTYAPKPCVVAIPPRIPPAIRPRSPDEGERYDPYAYLTSPGLTKNHGRKSVEEESCVADCMFCAELCFTPYQAAQIYKENKKEELRARVRIPWNYTDDRGSRWRGRWEWKDGVEFLGGRYDKWARPMTTTERVCEVAKRTAIACCVGSTYACIPIPCCTPCVWMGCNVDFRADPCCLHADYYRENEGVPYEEYCRDKGGRTSRRHGDGDSRSRGQSAERQPLLDHRSSVTREQPRQGGGTRVPPVSGTSARADEESFAVRQQPKKSEGAGPTVRERRTHLAQDETPGAVRHSLDEPGEHRCPYQNRPTHPDAGDRRWSRAVDTLMQSLAFQADVKRVLGNEYRKAALLISSRGQVAVKTPEGCTHKLYAKLADIEDDTFRRCCKAIMDLTVEYSFGTRRVTAFISPERLWQGDALSGPVSYRNEQQPVSDPSVVREQPMKGVKARVAPAAGGMSAKTTKKPPVVCQQPRKNETRGVTTHRLRVPNGVVAKSRASDTMPVGDASLTLPG